MSGQAEYSEEHGNLTRSVETTPRPIVNEIRVRGLKTQSLEETSEKYRDHGTQLEDSYVMLPHPENDIEAHRISNNYLVN